MLAQQQQLEAAFEEKDALLSQLSLLRNANASLNASTAELERAIGAGGRQRAGLEVRLKSAEEAAARAEADRRRAAVARGEAESLLSR
eukprot:CAMPEP_0180321936 /NCGR_PEP_ID=MMETSP0988-20121125/36417_1 /TAXON_ID=697907 /ORGANISM="non described non described, Strain CCMP2293" /LENGTH=87 /DNA_ID=CAMNT_0022307853 /DNA_START=1 /DNA_END=261 /DNA_ORIENTATION=+